MLKAFSDDSFKPYWYIIIEAIYILIYLAISVIIHQLGVLKVSLLGFPWHRSSAAWIHSYVQNDDDAVTIHHRIHKEIIAQQELCFMNQMKVSCFCQSYSSWA